MPTNRLLRAACAAAVLWVSGVPGAAQSNTVPGLDASLTICDSLTTRGRDGVYPNGQNGLSMGVVICNVGSVDIDWRAPMDPRHPMYSFVVARERDGRFEQISDRSYVKHGFASINGSRCGTCRTSNGSLLGPNCSDTYSSSLNANRYYLGPQEEIDPWLGVWDPVGSHFDRGEPDVGPPANADGIRSLTSRQAGSLPPVRHRVVVSDRELLEGGDFYYGLYVVVRGEAGTLRDDNFVNRRVTPRWTGSSWSFTDASQPATRVLLENWSGAVVNAGGNGADDGVFYVGVKVTGPDAAGMYRYEYALHNRDNARGGGTFRLPRCATARIANVTFRDIDDDPSNDWSVRLDPSEIVFTAPQGNASEWNTVFNFGFDSDAAPIDAFATIDQARTGAGAGQVRVMSQVPGFLPNEFLGDGCGSPAPTLRTVGTPAWASIPNASFGLRMQDMAAGASGVVLMSVFENPMQLNANCTLHIGLPTADSFSVTANPQGFSDQPLPVPNLTSLEGASLFFQGVEVGTSGPAFGQLELSNGLEVRIGNSLTACPR